MCAAAKIGELQAAGQAAVLLQPGQRMLASGEVLYLLPLQDKVRSPALELGTMRMARLHSSTHSPSPHRFTIHSCWRPAIFRMLWQLLSSTDGACNGGDFDDRAACVQACLCVCLLCSLSQRIRERKPRRFSLKAAQMRAKMRNFSLALRGA